MYYKDQQPLAFRQNEYKKIVESLVSNSPGENDAICFHAGVELFENDRTPRHHYIQSSFDSNVCQNNKTTSTRRP